MSHLSLSILAACFLASGSQSEPFLKCDVETHGLSAKVRITVQAPHPEEMLIRRPDGSYVYLQSPSIPHTYPKTDDFQGLGEFVIDTTSRGTEYVNGEGVLAPLLRGAGVYWLLIAENVETELENTLFFECSFTIRAN